MSDPVEQIVEDWAERPGLLGQCVAPRLFAVGCLLDEAVVLEFLQAA